MDYWVVMYLRHGVLFIKCWVRLGAMYDLEAALDCNVVFYKF